MDECWGPWIEHDGKGEPVPDGTVVQVAYASGNTPVAQSAAGPWWRGGGYRSWKGVRANYAPIIRYRIRKPRALIELIEMVENLPAPTERVDA